MKTVLLLQAQEDLDGIVEPLLSKMIKRLRALRRYPDLGAALTGPYTGYQSSVVGPFRIIYKRASPEKLFITYIRHCRRH